MVAHKITKSVSGDAAFVFYADLVRLFAGVGYILIISVISACLSYAFAGTCDKAPAPQVEIEIARTEVQEAYDITAADIDRLAQSTGERPSWPGLGASSSDIAYGAEISESAAKERDGSYCATAAYVRIVITLKNRMIHLARELKEKPCLERIQRERLLRFAHADEQALDEFPSEGEMRHLLGQLRPEQAKSELAARAQVTTAVRKKIQVLLDAVQDYAAELRRKMTPPEEVDRLRREVKTDPNCR